MTTKLSNLNDINININQALYLYQKPMFSLTVSVVLISDNGIFLLREGEEYRFPGGDVKASQESIQFAAVRWIKEQIGIVLKKDTLIPVDFRSDPERTISKNVVDIGFVCIAAVSPDVIAVNKPEVKWEEIDFENKCLIHKDKLRFYMDHELLLERALTIASMMKD